MSEFEKKSGGSKIPDYPKAFRLVRESGGLSKVDPELLSNLGFVVIEREVEGSRFSELRPINSLDTQEKEKKKLEPFPSFDLSLQYSTEVRTEFTYNLLDRFNKLARDVDRIIAGRYEKNYHYQTLVGDSAKTLIEFWDSFKYGNYETSDPVKSVMLDYFARVFNERNISTTFDTDYDSMLKLTEPEESETRIDALDVANADVGTEKINFSKEYMSDLRNTLLKYSSLLTDEDLVEGYFDILAQMNEPLTSKSLAEFIDTVSLNEYCRTIGITDDRSKEYENIENIINKGFEELSKRGYSSIGEVMLYFVGEEILNRLGELKNDTLSEIFKGVDSLRQAKDRLTRLSDELISPYKKEIKNQKRAKSTTKSSEEHKLIEERIKTAKGNIEKVNQIISPFIETFNLPSSYCRVISQKLKDMMAIVGQPSERVEVFTFDAAKNSEVDKNAGSVSGDCTTERPLDFRSTSSLYNIKVYNSHSQHCGNIYMAEIENTRGEVIAWHLDAIQIPVYLDWVKASKSIRDALITQAKAKSVKTISINKEFYEVSNYSDIAQSFLDLSSQYQTRTEKYLLQQLSKMPGAIPKDKSHFSLQAFNGRSLRRLY